MAKIELSTEMMRQAANDFAAKIADWNGMKDEIWTLLADLDAMWDGDANEAFNALIAEDEPKFTRLLEMMETYKDAINTAAQKYDEGEGEIKNIVTRRM
ncbi:MAG: WXG100 family type VII secretion target [Clostridia bacterium]|nr:WXG100 family type VII secretion target [Clostridia bacterium]